MSDGSEFAGSEKINHLAGIVQLDAEQLRSHVDEVVRGTVEETLNALLDAEADALCGAKRYERSADRVDTRAGHYERQLHTKAGEVTLTVPRLRTLPFETQIIDRYRRRESSVEEALVEMYLAGVSVRRVEDITEALWGTRVSPSTVSELNQKIAGHIETWRNRPIEGEHPYVFLDGLWLKRSWGGEVKNVAVLVALGGAGGRSSRDSRRGRGRQGGHGELAEFIAAFEAAGSLGRAADHQRQVSGPGGSDGGVLPGGGLAAVHGALVPQRVHGGAEGEGEGSGRDA